MTADPAVGWIADWDRDDLEAALAPYAATRCGALPRPAPAESAGSFFRRAFRPGAAVQAFVTGYFEPVIPARLQPGDGFSVPVLAMPPDPDHGRAAIMAGALAGRGLEIAWLADPVDLFFLQVQGSGRLVLPDGRHLRLGYAGRNGRPYTSLGATMAARGLIPADGVTADSIRAWLAAHPAQVAELLNLNDSYVFFRRLDLPDSAGPVGTAGVPLTPGRSIAVDPAHVPLGLPVWLSLDADGGTVARLAVAQDTGSAITGAGRADLFIGTGDAAGRVAGRLRSHGVMVPLVPVTA